MSETQTAPQDSGAADTHVTDDQAQIEPSAAASKTADADPTGEASADSDDDDRKPLSPAARRIAAMSARIAAGEQERARLASELEALRQRTAPPPATALITADDIPRIVEERVAAELAARQSQERRERFHEAGYAAFKDWDDRCNSLVAMGADPGFASLLLEVPDGARVAGALADDPEEMERIAKIRTERGRAIALGKFAASLEAKPAIPTRQVSRAPDPIRPINGAAARVEFNELTATPQQLVEYYSRQAMKARGL